MKVVASFFPNADRCYGDVRSLIRAQDGGCVVVPIVLFFFSFFFFKLICQNVQPVSYSFGFVGGIVRGGGVLVGLLAVQHE